MPRSPTPPDWWAAHLTARLGVVTWAEIRAAGMVTHARTQLATGLWQRLGPAIVLTAAAEPSPQQRTVAAVLHGGPGAALAGLSALVQHHGLTGWSAPSIEVAVTHRVTAWPGARHHETSCPVEVAQPVPVVTVEHACVQAAAWAPDEDHALAIVRTVLRRYLVDPTGLVPLLMLNTRHAACVRRACWENEHGILDRTARRDEDVRRFDRVRGQPTRGRFLHGPWRWRGPTDDQLDVEEMDEPEGRPRTL